MTKYSIQARLIVEDTQVSTKLAELEALGMIIANVMPVRTAPVAPMPQQ